MRRIGIFILIQVCAGCASASSATLSAKATRNADPTAHAIELRVEAAPPEVESPILTNAAVVQCLRKGIDPADAGFVLTLEGKTAAPDILGGNFSLNACLTSALRTVSWPPVDAFHLELRRPRGGEKGKGFRLDLNDVKKLE